MSRLLHPNCVSVIDFGVEGSPYLVMDFVTGRTVREVLQEGPLPATKAFRITQQILAGLAYAHAQGIVHRDLKPENLILSDEPGLEEHLRILDFGLAKLRDGPAMTAGLAVGTPSYMSPEQSGAPGDIDARTDIYTVGIVLFELLSGRKPFVSENVGEIILMHREAPPPPLRRAIRGRGIHSSSSSSFKRRWPSSLRIGFSPRSRWPRRWRRCPKHAVGPPPRSPRLPRGRHRDVLSTRRRSTPSLRCGGVLMIWRAGRRPGLGSRANGDWSGSAPGSWSSR